MASVVIVSGAPGSGKSTVAVPLATALGFPLLSKDVIKEQLHDSLAPLSGDAMESSRRLGSAAMDLLWTLAGRFPQVVLEANFRPHSEYERSRLMQLGSSVEVYCCCPSAVAAARFAQRARDASHHPVHVLHELPAELLAEYDGPMAIGDVLEVDTTEPIDASSVTDDVQALLRRNGG